MEEEWKSTPSLEMRKVAKTATGLNSYGTRNHAFNLRALTVQAGQATNDTRVLEGEIFPP